MKKSFHLIETIKWKLLNEITFFSNLFKEI
jgi:hypothetical protein